VKHASRRQKGRRLQVTLAEALAVRFDLTIEAVPPTPIGVRDNGAVYVSEARIPDLRVRRMGEAGVDVMLLSAMAHHMVAMQGLTCIFECKNVEKLALGGADWWKGQGTKLIAAAIAQARAHAVAGEIPVAVVSKNLFPTLVVWERHGMPDPVKFYYRYIPTIMFTEQYAVAPLEHWLGLLDGAAVGGGPPKRATRAKSSSR
jgi:GNAT superfamily N-acetyltransferase